LTVSGLVDHQQVDQTINIQAMPARDRRRLVAESSAEQGISTTLPASAANQQQQNEAAISAEHLALKREVARMKAAMESKQMPRELQLLEIPILLYKINKLKAELGSSPSTPANITKKRL
jgi:hypothetical protein